jgi:hypothetical protein
MITLISLHPSFRKNKYHIYTQQCHFSSHITLSHCACSVYILLSPHSVPPKPRVFTLHKKRFINFHLDAFACIFAFFCALFLWASLSLWRQLLIFHHRREKLCVLSFMLDAGPTKCRSPELQSSSFFFSI